MGSGPEDKASLGAEIAFWMGEGDETEIIKMNTSGLIFVPKGLLHLPIFFKNVKKPLIWIVIALNIGQTLEGTTKYPVRGL